MTGLLRESDLMNKKFLLGYSIVIGFYLMIVLFGIIKYNSDLAQTINWIIMILNVIILFAVAIMNKLNKRKDIS